MNPSSESDPVEGKRLLELVAFARREREVWRFTWRHGVFFGLAALSLFAALRCWTTWWSFHRPVEVHAAPGITEAEQGAMIAAIRSSCDDLDPVAMDAASFQNVFFGRSQVERSAVFVREGGKTRVTVRRCDGTTANARLSHIRIFTFGETGNLIDSVMHVPVVTCFFR